VGIYHKIRGDTGTCGGNRFNPDKECCVNGTIVEKCGGACFDPGTEYCENGNKCDKACSAGAISSAPAPINGEVILPIGGTAALSVSGETGGQFQWSASGGQLTVLSATKATITSANPGKIIITFGSKTCSACRTGITVAFVKVLTIKADRRSVNTGGTIKFTVTTEPAGAAYMNLVRLTPVAIPPDFLPTNLIVLTHKSLEEGLFIYQINSWGGVFVMRATAGGSDGGRESETLWVH